MKIKALFLTALLVSSISFVGRAEAKDLTADACVSGGAAVQSAQLFDVALPFELAVGRGFDNAQLAMKMPTLTCQEIKSAKRALTLMSAVLIPPRVALAMSGVGGELGASILALNLANPAVLGVTVLGAAGVSVFYIVLMQSEDECAKQDQDNFKRQIFKEIESKYGIHTLPSQNIEYR